MTVTYTIDSQAIKIKFGTFKESVSFAGSDWDAWESGGYKRKHKSYGAITAYSFTCFEDAVAVTWANSVAKHLYTHVVDGVAVELTITNGSIHTVPAGTTVYVEKVEVWCSDGMKTRYFNLTVRAA